jgi:hypothetical protein
MRSVLAVSIAALVLSACGKPTLPAATEAPAAVSTPATVEAAKGPQQGIAESLAAEAVTIPPAVSADKDVFAGLADGESAMLRLNACPSGFDAHAHLGSVMCGGDYQVFYEPATLRWVAVGPNADLKGNGLTGGKNPGPVPAEHIVVIWGLSLSVDPKTHKATIGDGTVVGELVHTSVAAGASAPSKP